MFMFFVFDMTASLKLQDFNKVCRLCLRYEDLQSIFQEKYLKLIGSLTKIEIKEGDSLPENVCKSCVKQLENILYFTEICMSSNGTLNSIISNTRLEAEVEGKGSNLSYGKYDSNGCSDRSPHFYKNQDVFSCPNCSDSFPSRKDLYEHFEQILNCRPQADNSYKLPNKRNKLLEIVDEGKIKLENFDHEQEIVCGKALKGKRKFLCNYCGKNYTRKNGLDRHIMSHTGIKPFECKECGKCYITKDTLKTHLLIHTGVKPYKCKICQKSFIQSSHLNYHMRRHAGEKPHACSFCGKGFLSTYHLERHKLMHTGVKPFKCDLCGKQFVRSTTLRDHLLLHTGERPFQCQHCGKQFNRKQTLNNHVNLVHLEEGANVINNNFTKTYLKEENMTKIEFT